MRSRGSSDEPMEIGQLFVQFRDLPLGILALLEQYCRRHDHGLLCDQTGIVACPIALFGFELEIDTAWTACIPLRGRFQSSCFWGL